MKITNHGAVTADFPTYEAVNYSSYCHDSANADKHVFPGCLVVCSLRQMFGLHVVSEINGRQGRKNDSYESGRGYWNRLLS